MFRLVLAIPYSIDSDYSYNFHLVLAILKPIDGHLATYFGSP